MNKTDCLALLPTGGGKSICFQVPALALEGICIVISPLIALMKDQVQNLQNRGIKASALYSGMSKNEIDVTLDNCIYGKIKFLYVSPERLSSILFITRAKKMNISFLAIDEAHCISQWGYDFRPAYLKIVDFRNLFPGLSVIALTATATPIVVNDIQEKLEFKNKCVIQKSFYRKNVSYSVLYEGAKYGKIIDILQKVNGSTIIYARNRRLTKEISEYITGHGISSGFYHAGLSNELREKRQQEWLSNKIRVMVATNAFGMGIDKPNVRLVIHFALPDSIEAYFQEAGRAGRDEKKAYAVLLFNQNDKNNSEKVLKETMPTIEQIREVYDFLGTYFQLAIGSGKEQKFSFDILKFGQRIQMGTLKIFNALKFLESEEYISLSESIYQHSKVAIKCSNRALDNFIMKKTKHNTLIQLMLRSYEGMFDGYTRINEKFLANKLNVSILELTKDLKFLESQNIILYEEQTNKPFVFFQEPRLDIVDLKLNVKAIKKRIQNFTDKKISMLQYAERFQICRSIVLLSYFGEKNANSCGICDVCLGRNKSNLSEDDIEDVGLKIKEVLKDKDLSIKELEQEIKINNKDKIHKVVKYLMNFEIIIRNENGTITLNR